MFNIRCEGWDRSPPQNNEAQELYVDVADRGTVDISFENDGLTVAVHSLQRSGDGVAIGDVGDAIETVSVDLNELNKEWKWSLRGTGTSTTPAVAVDAPSEDDGEDEDVEEPVVDDSEDEDVDSEDEADDDSEDEDDDSEGSED